MHTHLNLVGVTQDTVIVNEPVLRKAVLQNFWKTVHKMLPLLRLAPAAFRAHRD